MGCSKSYSCLASGKTVCAVLSFATLALGQDAFADDSYVVTGSCSMQCTNDALLQFICGLCQPGQSCYGWKESPSDDHLPSDCLRGSACFGDPGYPGL